MFKYSISVILIIMLVLFSSSYKSLSWAGTPKNSTIVDYSAIKKFSKLLDELQIKISSLTYNIMSYKYGHKRDICDAAKNEVRDIFTILSQGEKIATSEEKIMLEKLREMCKDLPDLVEGILEMEEMYESNVREFVDKAGKARTLMQKKSDEGKTMEKDAGNIILLINELEVSMVEMLSKTMSYLGTGNKDLKGLVGKDRSKLGEAMKEFDKAMKMVGSKGNTKAFSELDKFVSDVMRSSMDSVEDFDVVKSKITQFLDRIDAINNIIDMDKKKIENEQNKLKQ